MVARAGVQSAMDVVIKLTGPDFQTMQVAFIRDLNGTEIIGAAGLHMVPPRGQSQTSAKKLPGGDAICQSPAHENR